MTEKPGSKLLQSRASRRAVVGAGVTAAALASIYAAFGKDLFQPVPSDSKGGFDEAALSREDARVSHLLRRAGFGVTRAENDRYQAMGLEATTRELFHFDEVDDNEAESLADSVLGAGERVSPVAWWVTRIANTKRPLQEKMTLFWHGLLTSQISVVKDPQAMLDQNQFFRDNALGSFPDILKGVTKTAAMMVYLNMDGSHKSAPNENYPRELMELFSLGEGNFGEEDVREASRAFTGWRVPRQRNDVGRPALLEPVFRPQSFDSGSKTVFGRTGNFDADDVIDLIVEQPASARFIVGKLFAFFVYPQPDEADLEPFVEVYLESGRNIGATVEALLRSEAFYLPRAYRAIVKSPIEYAVSALKALGLQDGLATLVAGRGRGAGGVLAEMGQTLMEPPNVAGWRGGAAWLNSATIFARLNYIDLLTGGAAVATADRRSPAISVPVLPYATPAETLAALLPFALDDNVSAEQRAALLDFAGGPEAALSPDATRELDYLILGSPQFHLA